MSEEPKLSTKYVMVESSPPIDEDEIDLFELIRILIAAWKTIAIITVLCTVLAYAYAKNAPKVFKATSLLAQTGEQTSGVSSALGQFGGLAAIAGISIPSSSNIERVLATLKSREFLKKFISSRKLLPIIFNDLWDEHLNTWKIIEGQEELTTEDGIASLQSAIQVEQMKTGLITLSISFKDPKIAAQLANDLVKQLNEQLRQKAITDSIKRMGYLEQELAKTTLQDMRAVLYNLLESEKQNAMLANVNEDFALEVIDPAVVPEGSDKPRHKLIVALGVVCGGFFGVFAVFFRQLLRKYKRINQGLHTH